MAVEFLPTINVQRYHHLAAEISKTKERTLDTVEAMKLQGLNGRTRTPEQRWIMKNRESKSSAPKPSNERAGGKGNLIDIMA